MYYHVLSCIVMYYHVEICIAIAIACRVASLFPR